MAEKYTDKEINNLLQEQKPLPEDYLNKMKLRNKREHKEQELNVHGNDGNLFRLILRKSEKNQLDFSIILAVCPQDTNLIFRLCRYNGKSHEHKNIIEGNTFYDFHIHMATERYQELGTREDAYAEPSDRFSDFNSALSSIIDDYGFDRPSNLKDSQIGLFGGK